jgi:hypothetical protein
MRVARVLSSVLLLVLLAACQAPGPTTILSKKSSVELRAMQSRAFETDDRTKTVRTMIATLQDLGYTIDKVEPAAGTVTGTKLSLLRLTATAYPRGEKRMIVRSNAFIKMPQGAAENQVDDPVFYQQLFFEPLSKALFLTALQVTDADEPSAPTASAGPVTTNPTKQGN